MKLSPLGSLQSGFGAAKLQESEARDATLRAIKLPPTLKHLEPQQSSGDKKYAFSEEFLEQYYDETFKQDHLSINNSQLKQQQQLLQQHLPPQQHLQSQQQQKQQQHQTNYSIPKDGILPGGRLSKFAHNWKKITSQNWPLSIVQNGYQLQFITTPSPWKAKKIHHSPADQLAVDVAVDKFLKAGIIYRSPTTQNRDYLSNFFTVQEPTKRRPILDCTNLNKFLQIHHFKMEGIPALREEIIEQDDYMCKIDLKDAYVVVPIHKDSQPFLALENRGIVYNYSSLAFGLSVAPRVFTKLMRDAVEPLRAQGIRLIYYLDNFCILEKSKHKMMNTVHLVMNHLRELGFLINMEKSVITPSKIQEFLGFKINSRDMQISLPQVKINKILQRIKQVEKTPRRSCRWIASLLGKITAVIPAVSEALLHIRHIQRDLAKSLQVNRHRWDYDCVLSAKAKLEIQWWKDNLLQKNDLPIHHLPPLSLSALTIHVDASDTGWGVHSKVISKAGYWTGRERQESINVRELTAVYYYALRLHVKDSNFLTEINLHTDNMTALNRQDSGSMQPPSPTENTLPPCGRGKEYRSRSPQPVWSTNVRIIDSKDIFQPSEEEMGKILADRCLCSITQSPASPVLEPTPRSVCTAERCLSTRLDEQRYVHVPSLEADTASLEEVTIRQDQGSNSNHPHVADTVLVPHVTEDETTQSTHSMANKSLESDRMALVSKKRKERGMTDDVILHLHKANRESTSRMYNSAWQKYADWCKEYHHDPEAYDTKRILSFLHTVTHKTVPMFASFDFIVFE
ncbi:hypothetical protein G6F42_016481 [Rhizopus arrhizus]|nr:hypothetical protein G6F42_016481 [Rhizopus arrhizus]